MVGEREMMGNTLQSMSSVGIITPSQKLPANLLSIFFSNTVQLLLQLFT